MQRCDPGKKRVGDRKHSKIRRFGSTGPINRVESRAHSEPQILNYLGHDDVEGKQSERRQQKTTEKTRRGSCRISASGKVTYSHSF